jgi:hypothetical protein
VGRFGIAVLKLGFCCRDHILCVKSRKVVAMGSSSRFFLFTHVVVQKVPLKYLMGVQVVDGFCYSRNVSLSVIPTRGVTPCSIHSSCARARAHTHTLPVLRNYVPEGLAQIGIETAAYVHAS